MNLFLFALRNLQRRKVRTILTITGVALSVAVLFSLLAFQAGYEQELTKEVDSLGIHMLAVPKGCPYEAASLIMHGGVIPKYLNETDLDRVKNTEGVRLATPILLHQFIVNGSPHILYGIIGSEMRSIRPYWKVEGRFFEDNEKRVMVVGKGLADKEGLKVGQMLPFGPKKEPFEVLGILDTTGGQEDEFHFIPLGEVQRVFGKENRLTTIAVQADTINNSGIVADKIEEIPDMQVVTMTQITGTILNIVGSARTLLLSMILVILIITAVGISNTLMMTVHERTKEFGMLKAIGARSVDIMELVIVETLVVTFLGGLAGVLLTLLGGGFIESFIRANVPYAPSGSLIAADPVMAIVCISLSVALGLVCSIYPAIRSAKQSPMEAMRDGIA
ncbi:Macrolide export ATP-binding/permease protein MacB [anaerobic digester metagenome]